IAYSKVSAKNDSTCSGDLALAECKCANFSPFLKTKRLGMPITSLSAAASSNSSRFTVYQLYLLYFSTIGSIHMSIALHSCHHPASNLTMTGLSLCIVVLNWSLVLIGSIIMLLYKDINNNIITDNFLLLKKSA